jgi:hypothetical protein
MYDDDDDDDGVSVVSTSAISVLEALSKSERIENVSGRRLQQQFVKTSYLLDVDGCRETSL